MVTVPENAVVEMRSVSKSYGSLTALDAVSFKIDRGEIFGYIGPNGAGKTTTIKILVGLIKDYQGQVFVNGVEASGAFESVHKMLGYVPQESDFHDWRTVEHALITFAKLSGVQKSELQDRLEYALNLVDLNESRKRKIRHLSGGMKQRLRFAQAVIHVPSLVVLDEPLSGLDPASRYQVRKTIIELARQGKTILVSSHILGDIEDIATKIGIISHGTLVKIGTPENLRNEYQIGNTIRIRCAYDSDGVKGLENLPSVDAVEKLANATYLVRLLSDIDLDEGLNAILTSLLSRRVRIREVSVVMPSLEDVYMTLVGDGGSN